MRHFARILLIGSALSCFALQTQAKSTPIELSDLVMLFMPKTGNIQWSSGSEDGRINWKTDGVTSIAGSAGSARFGTAVVAMDGKVLKELKKRPSPVAWEVEMWSDMPSKFDPKHVEIDPNFYGGKPLVEYLKRKGFQTSQICEHIDDSSNYTKGYRIENAGRSAYAAELTSGGSAGMSHSIRLYSSQPKDLCVL